MAKTLRVSEYMSPMPKGIDPDVPLIEAEALMDSQQIRHLPVYDKGRLIGIISQREILAASTRKKEALRVGDVMAFSPFTVAMEEDIRNVVSQMAENKYGSALVTDSKRAIVGIFTTTDALRLFGNLLKQNRL